MRKIIYAHMHSHVDMLELICIEKNKKKEVEAYQIWIEFLNLMHESHGTSRLSLCGFMRLILFSEWTFVSVEIDWRLNFAKKARKFKVFEYRFSMDQILHSIN